MTDQILEPNQQNRHLLLDFRIVLRKNMATNRDRQQITNIFITNPILDSWNGR